MNHRVICSTMVDAAHAAGAILNRYFRVGLPSKIQDKRLQIKAKPGAGLVTIADVQAEKAIRKILNKSHPDFLFYAEETAHLLSPDAHKSHYPQPRFLVDPLDGTSNFVHGLPFFCVSIGVEWDGKIQAGVVFNPFLNQLFVAIRGKGATLNGKSIKVSSRFPLSETLLTTGFAVPGGGLKPRELEPFKRVLKVARGVRRPGSAALDLAYTACGVFDGFWERNLKAWDLAAGSLLIEEAGGQISTFDGRPWNAFVKEIIATNGKIHRSLCRLLKL